MTVVKPIVDEFHSRFGSELQLPQKMFARGKSITEQDFPDVVVLKCAFRDSVSRHVSQHDEA